MRLSKEEVDELVSKILDRDNDAFEVFHEEFKNIIMLHANKWTPRLNKETFGLYSFEDLENEMWEMIIRKLPGYDSSKSSMVTWLYMICGQTPLRIQKYNNMPKRSPGLDTTFICLNKMTGTDGEDTEIVNLITDPKSAFENELVFDFYLVETIYRMKKFSDNLTDREQILYLHSLKGMTLQESGNILGVSKERIRQLKDKIEKKIFNTVYNATQSIDTEKSYIFFNNLISYEEDDIICNNYNYRLGTIKICREIMRTIDVLV